MSQDNSSAPSTGYTVSTRLDDSRSYDCILCAHSSPDVDGARAHKAVHVAGPDLLDALSTSRGQWIHSVNRDQCLKALAKAEPKG